ncbi:MAG: sugar phosphate isomerase/epimerase [Bryobacteraceae bacterium]
MTATRRQFLTQAGCIAAAHQTASRLLAASTVPVGLEMYSVRDELAKDLLGTVRKVGAMGYKVVEFYAPYYEWTESTAKDVRKTLDELGVQCRSTHNGAPTFAPDGIQKAIDLNGILGSKYVVMASPGRATSLDDWKRVSERLTSAAGTLKPAGMSAGYHNHRTEFIPLEGKRPIEIIAANTPPAVMLQFDIGTCVHAGSDPVAWIEANPGRIRSLHCKDWGAGEGKGYKVLFGEGDSPWKKIFAAAERTGGVEYYLIEQEGSRFGSIETAERCLATFKRMRV